MEYFLKLFNKIFKSYLRAAALWTTRNHWHQNSGASFHVAVRSILELPKKISIFYETSQTS